AIGTDGWPTMVESVHPDRVTVRRKLNSGPVEWRLDNEPIERWPLGPLWHVPAYVMPGNPVGMSPIRYAAEQIGLGLAVQDSGSQLCRAAAHRPSIFECEHEVTEPQAKAIKARIRAATENNREPLVLGAGGHLNSIQVAPNESQFLETMQSNVA